MSVEEKRVFTEQIKAVMAQLFRPKENSRKARIAIIHDKRKEDWGAKHLVNILQKMLPDATILNTCTDNYFSVLINKLCGQTKFLQKLIDLLSGWTIARNLLLPLSEYDLIISTSISGRWLYKAPGQIHICYARGMDQVWSMSGKHNNTPWGLLARQLNKYLLSRIDHLLVDSTIKKDYLKNTYQSAAVVVYPPLLNCQIETDRQEDYYLLLAETQDLAELKRLATIFSFAHRHLLIASTRGALSLKDFPNRWVQIRQSDTAVEIQEMIAHSRGVILTSGYDLSIAAIWAHNAGKRVLRCGVNAMSDLLTDQATDLGDLKYETVAQLLDQLENTQHLPQAEIKQHFQVDEFQQQFSAFLEHNLQGYETRTINPAILSAGVTQG